MKLCKCNKMMFGIVAGFVVPLLTSFLLFSFAYYGDLNYGGFLDALMKTNNLARLLAVCALPNLIIFFAAINFEKLLMARGIVMSTLIIALLVVVFRFLL